MILILYAAKTKITSLHQRVSYFDKSTANCISIWIRTTTIGPEITADLANALDFARPMSGEVVLNAIQR